MMKYSLYIETPSENEMKLDKKWEEDYNKVMIKSTNAESLLSKKVKREEDDIDQIFSASYNPLSTITEEQKKLILKLLYRTEGSCIKFEDFWSIVKYDKDCQKYEIRSKNHLFDIINALKFNGMLNYSADEELVLKII